MKDERVAKLAHNLLTYSVDLQPGEKIYIEYKGDYSKSLLKELISKAVALGGVPFWFDYDEALQRRLLMGAGEPQLEAHGGLHKGLMEQMDAFVSIRGSNNVFDLSDVGPEQMKWHMQHFMKPVHLDVRVPKTKWVVLRYPNDAMAQLAERSQESFEDFYFQVCNLDYSKMSVAMDPLVALMNRTDRVRLVARDTDLSFSIKGIDAVKCDGGRNIPDGEVFTAPVRESINGRVHFNTPAMHQGRLYENIDLTFENGKAVKAEAGPATEALNTVLDSDAGARYVGEFALGVNPYITTPMKDTLFDEKIRGSFHMALGQCYELAPNGNQSGIHWDLVLIQTPEYGGGEIWFDDVLIRKDGLFVLPELQGLNPDQLG